MSTGYDVGGDTPVFVISVAAQLAGLHAQTLRQYDRLGLVSPVLAMVVVLPVYLVLMLALYVVMFGFYYHGWREIFGEPAEAPGHVLEL